MHKAHGEPSSERPTGLTVLYGTPVTASFLWGRDLGWVVSRPFFFFFFLVLMVFLERCCRGRDSGPNHPYPERPTQVLLCELCWVSWHPL